MDRRRIGIRASNGRREFDVEDARTRVRDEVRRRGAGIESLSRINAVGTSSEGCNWIVEGDRRSCLVRDQHVLSDGRPNVRAAKAQARRRSGDAPCGRVSEQINRLGIAWVCVVSQRKQRVPRGATRERGGPRRVRNWNCATLAGCKLECEFATGVESVGRKILLRKREVAGVRSGNFHAGNGQGTVAGIRHHHVQDQAARIDVLARIGLRAG